MTQFVVESLLFKLNSLLQKEFTPFLSFHQHLRKLAGLFTTIKPSLEGAELKQFSDRNIDDWLAKINDAAHKVDDMIDECAYEALQLEYQGVKADLSSKVQSSCLSSFHLNHAVFGYKMAKKMKRISKRLIEIIQEKNRFNLTETGVIVGRGNELIEGRPTTFFFHEPLCGRQRDIDIFLNRLISVSHHLYDLRVYSIEGEDGIGKTAFAKFIFHHQSVVDHFELRIWVGSFWDVSLKGMLEAITKAAIGCECEDLDLEILQKRLQYILQRKRYLIVFDFNLYLEHQSWNSFGEDWWRLKSILACGGVGATIVVSSPSSFEFVEEILFGLELSALSDNDCWTLFRQQVFKPNEKIPFELEAMGKEILKKLEQVPLAIKLLGGLLHSNREGKEWLNVKEYIGQYIGQFFEYPLYPRNDMRISYSLRSVLILSYLNLPTRLKKCFAYCTIFPKGETIRKAYLIELWMANGFLSSDRRLDVEDVGDDVCNELYRRSFFQDIERDEFGNLTGFKMHNIVFDFARLVANDVKCLIGDTSLIYLSSITKHLSDYRRKIELNSIDLQQVKSLRTYLIPNQCSDQFFPKVLLKCHSLRVLEFRLRGELSPSIGDLKHLRYLNLSKSDFKTIPEFMCKLWNLQILKLDYCKHLQKLPNSLTDLKFLEKLSFKGCHKLSSLPPYMGKLTSLRSLTSYVVGNERGFLLAELGGMKLKEDLDMKHLERVKSVEDAMEGNMSSKRLKELRLSWEKNEETKLGDNAEKILEVLQPDTEQLVSLRVIGYPGGSFPRWVFAHSLKKLQIERCRELKGLHKAFDSMTALHSLRLYDLPNLESLSDCFQHLRSLRQLAIGFCCKLADFPNSLRASMLERLDIYACYALEKQLCYWSTILLSCEIRVDGCLITKGSNY
ncbi:disease resistance protein RGA2-like [Phaseolus vulgaris]|uniref:disease resistance protein RGA2-like n=1 Tax=Phaseolus vulgaris TaxID=3885 RepID=UPI0035CC8D6E